MMTRRRLIDASLTTLRNRLGLSRRLPLICGWDRVGEGAMTGEPTTARAAWDDSYKGTRELLGGLSPNDLGRLTDNPGWTVRNLGAHMATADDFTARCIKPLSLGKNLVPIPVPDRIAGWIGDRQNAGAVKKQASASAAALVAALDTSHARAAALLDGLAAEAWYRPGKIPLLGTHTLASFIQQMADHAEEHAAALKRALVSE
jgi:hypothetical protein